MKFVHSKPFSEEVFGTPRTSAHAAFKRYIETSRSKKKRKAAKAAADGREDELNLINWLSTDKLSYS